MVADMLVDFTFWQFMGWWILMSIGLQTVFITIIGFLHIFAGLQFFVSSEENRREKNFITRLWISFVNGMMMPSLIVHHFAPTILASVWGNSIRKGKITEDDLIGNYSELMERGSKILDRRERIWNAQKVGKEKLPPVDVSGSKKD